ncbi:hypothetical protein DAQ1742_03522 [Dickeya aquatica]|uniref:Uncharacterized protein n=1 Tax=Dickeya aquatica TaxID=1401087 RepID=A0A375AE02_9GAMM|nr:hypothetical protein DAQ1742_03522 [Dickeya aquatica]
MLLSQVLGTIPPFTPQAFAALSNRLSPELIDQRHSEDVVRLMFEKTPLSDWNGLC